MFRSVSKLCKPLFSMQTRSLKEWTGEYLPNHEWIAPNKPNAPSYKMGLAKSGLEEFSELVFIDFPSEIGNTIEQGDDLVIMESVKASDTIAAPYDCQIVNLNEDYDLDAINGNPECIDNSWLVEIKPVQEASGDGPSHTHSYSPWGGHRVHEEK